MGDATKIRRTFFQVLWGDSSPFDFGFLDTVNPALDLKLDPIMTGSTGKLILGYRVVGLEGYVSLVVRESTLGMLQKSNPWWSSGSIPLVPSSPNVDLYTYAQLLKLHPVDKGATTTEDINLVKAVPIQAVKLQRDGKSDDAYELRYGFFPNRTKLQASPSVIEYGYVGDVVP